MLIYLVLTVFIAGCVMHKKFFRSNWEEKNLRLYEAEIISFVECNQIRNDKFKNVFYCTSKAQKEGRMCVMWGRTAAIIGDTVLMKGRLKGDTFLVWSMQIIKRVNQNGERNNE